MAPEPRRKPREGQYIFELGVRGRKTGLTLPDTGLRDKNGLEPMDHLFSPSPQKAPNTRSTKKLGGREEHANATLSGEEMDVGESTIPEPNMVLSERKRLSMRLPPRSKTPIRTYLKSPARRNPSLGPVSSPVRGSIVEPRGTPSSTPVRRKLDFTNASLEADENHITKSLSPQKRLGSVNPKPPVANGTRTSLGRTFSGDMADDSIVTIDKVQDNPGGEDAEDSFQMINGSDDDDAAVDHETEEIEAITQPVRRGRGRPKVAKDIPDSNRPPTKHKSTKPVMADSVPVQQSESEDIESDRPTKRVRTAPSHNTDIQASKPKKASRTATQSRTKGPGRPKLASIAETDSPQVQRGPPMPRRPGLLTHRRETPMDSTGFKRTLSGRNSIKPLAFWRNERAEYSEDEVEDKDGKFVVSRITGVVRVDELAAPKRSKGRYKSSKVKKHSADFEDEEDVEPWEAEPGRIYGDVLTWDPDDPIGARADDVQEEIALSSAAIITRDIPNASFKFAKTLTLPFFGSGMVDLPPGALKKPKNSRKMQMAFFVFYGRVKVNVNGNDFRISKGGMWQVPRGNTYSIENDYERPARIFFSQACEVEVLEDVNESQLQA